MNEIPALTVTQPYASLIAWGLKTIETRSWQTKYRGLLAIHAGAGLNPVGGKSGLAGLCAQRHFREAIEQNEDDFPLGCVVAVVNLTACHRIPGQQMHFARMVAANHDLASYPVVLPPFRYSSERAFGDYTPGRFAWLLHDVVKLDEPIPATGAQGLWKWSMG